MAGGGGRNQVGGERSSETSARRRKAIWRSWIVLWAGVIAAAATVALVVPGEVDFFLVFAAAALAITAGAHSLLGERFLLTPLFRRARLPRLLGDDAFSRNTLRFAWHLTSVAWLGFAALAAMLATGSVGLRPASILLALVVGTSALVALAFSRGRHLVWVTFALIALAVGLAGWD